MLIGIWSFAFSGFDTDFYFWVGFVFLVLIFVVKVIFAPLIGVEGRVAYTAGIEDDLFGDGVEVGVAEIDGGGICPPTGCPMFRVFCETWERAA